MKCHEWLKSIHACGPGVEWLGRRGPKYALMNCPRGDWLAWLLGALDKRVGVRATCSVLLTSFYELPVHARLREIIKDITYWAISEVDYDIEAHEAESAKIAMQSCGLYGEADKAVAFLAKAVTKAEPHWVGELCSIAVQNAGRAVCISRGLDIREAHQQVSLEQADQVRKVVTVGTMEELWTKQQRRLRG